MDKRSPLDEVSRMGNERFDPSLTDPNWLVLRERRRIFQYWMSQIPSAAMNVLDVGGRIQPYRTLLSNRLRRYTAVDVRITPLVDVAAVGEQLPFREGEFDLVICTQVLEYIFQPESLVAEVHRVLKPGGVLLLSAPSASLVDSANEYWRFLPAGLRRLLQSFARVEVEAEGSSVAGFFRTVNACFEVFARYPMARSAYRHSFCPVVNLVGALLEKLSGGRNNQLTVNYSVRAEK